MPTHKRMPSDPTTHPIPTKRPKRTPKPKPQTLIERVNALPLLQFSTHYFSPKTVEAIQSSSNGHLLHLTLSTWTDMHPSHCEACINLLELTSSSHYRASEMGWSRPKKLKEMRHPAMKYLLLLPSFAPEERKKVGGVVDQIEGFLSFMITEEDGFEVVYCYELHLQPHLQGKGMGRRMMEVMEMIGFKVGLEKAMLTVFRSNERAVKAYDRWGYGVDEFSPEPRKLRDGTVKEPTYVILSKERERFAHVEE